MSTTHPPRGVLFDLGDTLFEIGFDLEAGIKRLLSLTNAGDRIGAEAARKVGDGLAKASEMVRLGGQFEVSCETFHRNIFDRLGLTVEASWPEIDLEFFKATHADRRLEKGLVETLEMLKKQNIRMAIVSNSFHTGKTLEWVCEDGGIMHYFDFLISSADYGWRKPHPEIFETAIAKMGLPRESVWFVGNSREADVVGSKGVGLTSVWYNADLEAPNEIAAHIEVKGWGEFGDVFHAKVRTGTGQE